MTLKNDIMLGDDLDLREDAGTLDLVEGEATKQHQQLLLLCPKGSFKETPDAGVGITNYLENESPNEMLAEIKRQFNGDGMEINTMNVDGHALNIDAFYL